MLIPCVCFQPWMNSLLPCFQPWMNSLLPVKICSDVNSMRLFSALDELPAPTHLLLRPVVRRPTNPWLPPLQQQKHYCQVHQLLIRKGLCLGRFWEHAKICAKFQLA